MQPPPADLSKLKGILSASKAIMKKVETNSFTTGHIDARALNEDGVNELQAEGVHRPAVTSAPAPVGGFTEDQINNSKLPDIVKKAMLERPIPQLAGPNYTFSLDDVADVAEKPMGYVKTPQTKPRTITESKQIDSDFITISKGQLKEMVDELVTEKLLEHYTKMAARKTTEEAVKKTISMLVSEGKLVQKKKITQ